MFANKAAVQVHMKCGDAEVVDPLIVTFRSRFGGEATTMSIKEFVIRTKSVDSIA